MFKRMPTIDNELVDSLADEDQITITGLAGVYPSSGDAKEFMEKLMNKEDCCTVDPTITHPDIPKNLGRLLVHDQFDHHFFGVLKRHAMFMDPHHRIILERAYEAVLDAGLHPDDIKGSNTGVFVGSCSSESSQFNLRQMESNTQAIIGNIRTMMANHITYALELNGPSFNCDTACSSSMYAFEEGYRAIKEGRCDMAIVCGANICLSDLVTLQFYYLGVLNPGTGCRPFDDKATGYTRSDAIIAMVLQKQKDAKRIYAKVVHSKTNSDGYKETGITFPSSECQGALLKDLFSESKIDPDNIAFVEAHGTGTRVGDPEELTALDKFFKPTLEKPLLIGSIKGNIGHPEPSSGLCSITKGIYMLNFDTFVPNIHYDSPRKEVPALVEGRMRVVTEGEPLPEDARLITINCFGFGGANGNVILEKYKKRRENVVGNVPPLVCFSARTMEAVRHFQKELLTMSKDSSCVRLLHEIFRKPYPQHPYRSYMICDGEKSRIVDKYCNNPDRKLALVIGNCNAYNLETICEFLRLPTFQKSFMEVKSICENNEILVSLKDAKSDIPQETFNRLIMQLCLINLLSRDLKLNFSIVYGFGIFGKLVAAFAKQEISLSQVMLSAKAISKSGVNVEKNLMKILGSQAARYIYSKNSNEFAIKKKNHLILNIDSSELNSDSVRLISPNDNVNNLLDGIGKIYLEGFNLELANIYNNVAFPVGRGTAMISPLIKWKRLKHRVIHKISRKRYKMDKLEMAIGKMKFYHGHLIDERMLLPATGYLFHLWIMFAEIHMTDIYDTCVVFENVKFHKATHLEPNCTIYLLILLHSDGLFEICEKDQIVVTGYIRNADPSMRSNRLDTEVNVEDQEFLLTSKDVYKELRLRGYNYKGQFRGIHEAGPKAALIKWEENWVTFLDNMLQIAILQKDCRHLYVPVGIERLFIDCASHTKEMATKEDVNNNFVTVLCDAETKTFRSKYVEMRGLQARSIQKKRQRLQPILELHRFIPNELTCTLEESVRINMQLLLECYPTLNVKVAELLPQDFQVADPQEDRVISPFICNAAADLPLITPDVTVVTKAENLEIEHVSIQTHIPKENILCVVHSPDDLNEAFNVTSTNGFVMCLNSTTSDFQDSRFNVLTKHTIDQHTHIYFMRKKMPVESDREIVNISKIENVKEWLETLKKTMLSNKKEVIVLSQQAEQNGILGFINCLRREPGGTKARCVFLKDVHMKFNAEDPLFARQLEKGLPINVLEDGKWGTYKHLLISQSELTPCNHIYANTEQFGDLSSLTWRQGPLTKDNAGCQVAYSALNFRDLMLAYGKITTASVAKDRFQQMFVQGLEFSGYNSKGTGVFGFAKGAIANLIRTPDLEIEVPKGWTLEDAATVSAVYSTCLFALIIKAQIRKGQSILIHSGCGGIGLAAINICTYYECNIFVTVGTQERKEYLLKNYPHLKATQIGNSRNTSFKEMVFKETGGKGVDLVLNSLADDKLKASVQCLARHGIFLEIGKYDLEMNNNISLDLVNRECTYMAIMLDAFMETNEKSGGEQFDSMIKKIILDGLKRGYVKPLPRTVFQMNELEKAFRYMSTGKHIGKVLIQIDQNADKLPGLPRYYCDSRKSYLVFGGLGGFGLELCDWLVLRGAKNLVISSRTGLQTGYQKYRLALWKGYGVNVSVSVEDVLTEEGCRNILDEANKLGPVDGIFNLAVVLKDAILENQTSDTMLISYRPKALLTQHLDKLSRQLCPELNKFVVFSSVSCGRGNAGQTNYGYSNSVMERICEIRRRDGLPGLAVQWGAVGDVGLLEDLQRENNEIAIGGTLQQKISNCLDVFDRLIQQPDAIVSSMIVAEKFGHASSDNPVDAVVRILGLKSIKSISMHAPLTELGMDSMMGMEIKQTLERDFDIVLNADDIRTLTFAKLEAIASGELKPGTGEIDRQLAFNMMAPSLHLVQSKERILTVNENAEKCIWGFPGVEGVPETFVNMAKFINVQIKYPHYNVIGDTAENTIESITDTVYAASQEEVSRTGSFKIVSHSYGAFSALKLAFDFERVLGARGTIVLIDSAPLLMMEMQKLIDPSNTAEFESHLLVFITSKLLPEEDRQKMKEYRVAMVDMANFNERVEYLVKMYKLSEEEKFNLNLASNALHRRVNSALNFKENGLEPKLKSKVFLYKPKVEMVPICEDYDLGKWCEKVIIKTFDGNHQTILDNEEMFRNLKDDIGI